MTSLLPCSLCFCVFRFLVLGALAQVLYDDR